MGRAIAKAKRRPQRGGAMMKSLGAWLARLLAPKADNFKALLLADLGLKR